jgi:hypothetical protein
MCLLEKGLQRIVYNSALLNQILFHKIVQTKMSILQVHPIYIVFQLQEMCLKL